MSGVQAARRRLDYEPPDGAGRGLFRTIEIATAVPNTPLDPLTVRLRLPSLDVERPVGIELVPRLIVLESAGETDRPVRGKPAREVIAVRVSVDFQCKLSCNTGSLRQARDFSRHVPARECHRPGRPARPVVARPRCDGVRRMNF